MLGAYLTFFQHAHWSLRTSVHAMAPRPRPLLDIDRVSNSEARIRLQRVHNFHLFRDLILTFTHPFFSRSDDPCRGLAHNYAAKITSATRRDKFEHPCIDKQYTSTVVSTSGSPLNASARPLISQMPSSYPPSALDFMIRESRVSENSWNRYDCREISSPTKGTTKQSTTNQWCDRTQKTDSKTK